MAPAIWSGLPENEKTEGETTSIMCEAENGVDISWLRRWDKETKGDPPSDAIDFMNMLEELEFK